MQTRNATNATSGLVATLPNASSRLIPAVSPRAVSAASRMPVIAPPAISPDDSSTPGPESAAGPSRCS